MIEPREPIPVSREALTRLFAVRGPRPVAEIATLFGWPAARVRRQAAADEGLHGDTVEWRLAARWVLDSWSLPSLFEILGSSSHLLPQGLRVTPVDWQLPAYLLQALRVQAAHDPMTYRVRQPVDLADYLWDFLHQAIEPDTVRELRNDPRFIEAFHFPEGMSDE